MQSIRFDFNGEHEILVPDGGVYGDCARDVIQGVCYPFPAHETVPIKSVVDLGAHAGEFTVMAALHWRSAVIHAYEPHPLILPLLRHNCRDERIVIHPQAVHLTAGRMPLYLNQIGTVAATLVEPGDPAPDGRSYASVEVEVVGTEAVIAHEPDVLKIDIEGPEGDLLEAMGSAVARIQLIYAEFHHENIRRHIDSILSPTHDLWYAHILKPGQGEVMYGRRI